MRLTLLHAKERVVYYPKVYFGRDSVAQIILHYGIPNKVDTFRDWLATVYATCIDFITKYPAILTHYADRYRQFWVAKRWNILTLKGRFKVLHKLIEHVDEIEGFPNKQYWHSILNKLESLFASKKFNEVYKLLVEIAKRTNTLELLDYVYDRIMRVKSKPYFWIEALHLI